MSAFVAWGAFVDHSPSAPTLYCISLWASAAPFAVSSACEAPEAAFDFVQLLTAGEFDQLRFSLAHISEEEEKAEAYEQLRCHMQSLLLLVRDTPPAYKLECQARLFAITSLLAKYFSQRMSPEEQTLRRTDMARLEPILEYAQLHHGEDITLDSAADAMGLNKEYFCRLFKKNMGVSYLQYLYQIRTTAVCRDLETSEDPIGEIAQRHGFRDNKMLNQYFREIYGCTPSEKRKFFREVNREAREEQ